MTTRTPSPDLLSNFIWPQSLPIHSNAPTLLPSASLLQGGDINGIFSQLIRNLCMRKWAKRDWVSHDLRQQWQEVQVELTLDSSENVIHDLSFQSVGFNMHPQETWVGSSHRQVFSMGAHLRDGCCPALYFQEMRLRFLVVLTLKALR